ncbi:MAG: hypothetical protein NVSMB5_24630 [Candidatus Velthaea sp.]
MARIPLQSEHDPNLDPALRATFEHIAGARGAVANIHRAMGNSPEALETFHAFSLAFRSLPGGVGSGSLTPAQTELAYTAATVANNCFY